MEEEEEVVMVVVDVEAVDEELDEKQVEKNMTVAKKVRNTWWKRTNEKKSEIRFVDGSKKCK